jgi:predicted acyltransferase
MDDSSAQSPESSPSSQRVESIDALRGFDMFWIIGADSLVHGLRRLGDSSCVGFLADQLEHVPWDGFRFYDLIFPLFVFVMGTSTVFSLTRIVETHGRAAAYRRVMRRAIVLYLLGLVYYGAMSRDGGTEMFRYVGVLQRIAICYLCGAVLFLNFRVRGLAVACVILLVGYWALLTFVPVPDEGAGNYAEGMNLANYIDQKFLPGYKWDGDWDPEGLLSTLPAVATGILGIFAGLVIHSEDRSRFKRLGILLLLGVVCLVGGWLWWPHFPVIKKIWTSSFVLWAAGWSYLLMALFYLVIDVWKLRLWARPFVWIGMNCITIYMLDNLIGFRDVVRRVIHQPMIDAMQPYGQLLVSVLSLVLAVWICYYLYQRRIFLRV